MLWERHHTGRDDSEAALDEITAHTFFPFVGGGKGKPAPFCANCYQMLMGVTSVAKKLKTYPGGELVD
jgi:hypothetical protein